MNGRVVTTDLASAAVLAIIDRMGNTRALNERVATGIKAVTRAHILKEAPLRHRTAKALGAKPTRAYADTARRVTAAHDAKGAEIEVPRFIFRRAFESFTIRPVRANLLTIATHAASYGRRVGDVRRRGWTIFQPAKRGAHANASRIDRRDKGGRINRRRKQYKAQDKAPYLLGIRRKGDKPTLLYVLKTSVLQRQDRTLLPSDEDFLNAARVAASEYAISLVNAES